MPTSQPPDRAALGRARLAARARRVVQIRRRVVAATLAAFVLAWGLIVFDGSMGRTTLASTAATTSSGTASANGTGSTSSGSGVASGNTSSSAAPSSSSSPPAVTTGQS